MNKDVLRNVGLTDSEIDVYLDLAKNDESLASAISLRIKTSRTYVYDSIQNLIDKGLIVYVIKNNRRYFKALEAEKLLDYLEEKESQLQKQKKDVKGLIDEMKTFQKPLNEKPTVEVFEGVEGLKTILNDIVKQEKDVVGWGATDRIRKYVPEWFLKKYVKDKAKKGIKTRQLYAKGEKTLEGKGYTNIPVPKELSGPVTFLSYGDKIAIFFWSETPIAIRMKNKDVSDSFRNHFEFLWRKIKN